MTELKRYEPEIEMEEGDAYVAFYPTDDGHWCHVSEVVARIAVLERQLVELHQMVVKMREERAPND